MRQKIKTLATLLLLLGGLANISAVWATVTSVVPPTAGTSAVTLGQSTSVTGIWRVNRATPCGTTVSSSLGRVHAGSGNGPVLLTIPAMLTQTQSCATSQLLFTETFLIPASVTQRAQKLGFANVVYVRAFDDGNGASSGEWTLPITGSATAALSVVREALAFDNGAAARVLGRNEPLGAFAQVSFTGTGLLQAQWEIAGPESTSGTPIYRVLSQVRQYVTGGDTHTFRSPELPTNAIGLHLLRLRITDPAPSFETPVIRYFVSQEQAGKELPAPTLALGGPPPRALLAPDTAFLWEAIKGARAYQLEVYAGQEQGIALPDLDNSAGEPRRDDVAQALSRPAITGMLVSGTQTRAALSGMARQHLLPGRTYYWRVLAIGADGSVIGLSPVRELRTP